ncbi:MAG: benzoyl-CoA reductase subunit B [Candidatus Melainabacteria bacterium]|nr:benzoyl-CoA reductase subunit B [Candidatus Melainabacteria bacterium]
MAEKIAQDGANSSVQKDQSMEIQKRMLAAHAEKLWKAKEEGKKVVYTFVPGNLTELILASGALPVYPEINALQSGMRNLSADYIQEAERIGHSEDVCTYVKCDVGMMLKGNVGPTGVKLPEPDLLLLSYTGCFVFMKWFENLKQHYNCPCVMLHVPYQADGVVTDAMKQYVVDQIRDDVIPALEKVTGKKIDMDELRRRMQLSRQAEDDLVWTLQSAKRKPSPIDAYFVGVYYIGPLFSAFRGTEDAVEYYRALRAEVEDRIKSNLGPMTPEGVLAKERYRLVVEGPPNWTSFRDFWKIFYDEGAVVVASSYTKVGGLYDRGFRHDPEHPLESLAEYCMGCYTNLNIPSRIDLLEHYIREYNADGFIVNSIKSCNSFSAGQLLMMRELEQRTGVPGGFIESDLVDPRYYSQANIKNRLESYFQMLAQRRAAGSAVLHGVS